MIKTAMVNNDLCGLLLYNVLDENLASIYCKIKNYYTY